MCESEFLLVKQAAAERLGVSPERLRIKYFSKTFLKDETLSLSCLFVTSVAGAITNVTTETVFEGFNLNSGTVLFDDVPTCNLGSFYNFFCQNIESVGVSIVSGFSFEVV